MTKIKCPNCGGLDIKLEYRQGKFKVLFCSECETGFTFPVPKNIGQYYASNYWLDQSFLGLVKRFVYKYFQKRRKTQIENYLASGKILDVGAGEGEFAKGLVQSSKFKVQSIDATWAEVKNPSVLKVDFLKWKTAEKFNAVTFWESLEHTPAPQKYLKKAADLLKSDGLVFIEYPRFKSLEARWFGSYWYHLDLPRHLSHLTDQGLSILLERAGFKIIEAKSILAPEYSPIGLMASLLNMIGINIHSLYNELCRSRADGVSAKAASSSRGFLLGASSEVLAHKNRPVYLFIIMVILSPVILLSILIEIILWRLNMSPIGLIIARKNE